jgi:hypothetical protein
LGEVAGRNQEERNGSNHPTGGHIRQSIKKKLQPEYHFGLPLSLSATQITKYLKIFHCFL